MLSSLIRSVWRSMRGNASDDAIGTGSRLEAHVRTAIAAFLRQPPDHPKHFDFEMVGQFLAAAGSAEYMVQRMMHAQNLVRSDALLRFALDQCTVDGLIMEFGVYQGASLRAIAQHVKQSVHGFDSFEGLPEDWTYYQKRGRFSQQGRAPKFDEPNVQVHPGWFDKSLQHFLRDHSEPVRFAHIDCDIYSSTKTVLGLLKDRIVCGTVIVFDEYLNYPGWREHEYKAFQEFASANDVRYRYLAFASSGCSVAVIVE